jgi:hypothetical protein
MRASRSAEPPAWNGTMIVTGRCGHASSAHTGVAMASELAATNAKAKRIKFLI